MSQREEIGSVSPWTNQDPVTDLQKIITAVTLFTGYNLINHIKVSV